jgi:hypothetical protein
MTASQRPPARAARTTTRIPYKDISGLREFVRIQLARIVSDAAKRTMNMEDFVRTGLISGYLIQAGIKLAQADGCSQATMEEAVVLAVREQYKKRRTAEDA